MNEKKNPPTWLFCFSIFALATITYAKTIYFEFVFDDYLHIILNTQIKSIGSSFQAFFEPMPPGNLYRPVLILSYAFTHLFSDLNPFGFHLINVLLHSVNCLLLFFILRQFSEKLLAFSICMLFAVHPLISEAVANVSGRSELLVHFFGLSSLLLSLYYLTEKFIVSKSITLILVSFSFLAALFSKESAIVYLGLVVLFAYYKEISLKQLLQILTPLSLCIIIYACFRLNALGFHSFFQGGIAFIDNPLIQVPWYERMINSLYLLTYYFMLTLLPYKLSADYSFAQFIPLSMPPLPSQLLMILCLIIIFTAGIVLSRRKDLRGVFILWFFIGFLITANFLFPIGTVFAERLMYLPIVGVIGLLVTIFSSIRSYLLKICAVTIVLSAFFILTDRQSNAWSNNLSLWEHQMLVAPKSFKTPANYGAALIDANKFELAKIQLQEAVRRNPHSESSFNLLGIALEKLGKNQEAETAFKQAIEINPNFKPAYSGYSQLLIKLGRNSEAEIISNAGNKATQSY